MLIELWVFQFKKKGLILYVRAGDGSCISIFSHSTFSDLLSEMYTSEHVIVLYVCHKRINFIYIYIFAALIHILHVKCHRMTCFLIYSGTTVVFCNKNLLERKTRCTHMHVQVSNYVNVIFEERERRH